MKEQNVSIKNVITFAGAYIAFLLGSGFATGQEVMQYFSSYGYWGILGTMVTLLLLLFVGVKFMTTGQEEQFEKGSDIFRYYCGYSIGNLFDYFSILCIFMSFAVMLAGSGATFQQHLGKPVWLGASTMAAFAGITVIFGLKRIVEIIGRIGPLIITIAITLGLVTIFKNLDGFSKANQLLPNLILIKASTNWFFSAASYVGFCMLWLASFLTSMGGTANSKKEAALGGAVGAISFSLAVLILALGILVRIEDVVGSQIPSLILATSIHPWLADIFSFIIITGIYTTAVPLLWMVSSRFTEDRSPKFRILTIMLAFIGLLIGIYLPFSKLVNTVYVINGYVGIILLLFMIVKTFRIRVNREMAIPPRNFRRS